MLAVKPNEEYHRLLWGGFLIISCCIILVYFPSLQHQPRGDQGFYLQEIQHKTSLKELTLGCIDLNRHRQFHPGDQLLFRPLLYIVLGAEQYFFKDNDVLWQGFGILLHILNAWFLLRLLLAIYEGWEAVWATALFAVLFVNIEMVIWTHIHSYMIFTLCVLAALQRWYGVVNKEKGEAADYRVMFLWLMPGAFTYEMGSCIAIILYIFLIFLKPKECKQAIWLLMVPLIYVASSCINYFLNPCMITFSTHPGFSKFISDLIYMAGSWVYIGIFPFEVHWYYGDRTVFALYQGHLLKPLYLWSIPSVMMIGTYMLVFQQRFHPKAIQHILALMFIFFNMLLAAFIVVGRAWQWDVQQVLCINTYYLYMFWLFMIIGLYAVIDWSKVKGWPKVLLCIFIAEFILINALALYKANEWRNFKSHGIGQSLA